MVYELEMAVVHDNYTNAGSLDFNVVDVFGLSNAPHNITVDGIDWNDYEFNQTISVTCHLWCRSNRELIPLVAIGVNLL